MDWKLIPSLVALRAFEATARHGSYVGAAHELNVTDAALRQHVRYLEAFFEMALVERNGRGILVTQEGRAFAEGLSGGFEEIQNAVQNLQKKQYERPVRVALTPAFAENWLIPRLVEFWTEHPDIEIDLAPSIKPVDLGRGGFDLAIRYGTGKWLNCQMKMIASAEYTVVGSPALFDAGSDGTLRSLNDAVWLFEETREEHRNWATKHGLNFDAERNRFYRNNSLVLSAVRAGHGLSVQSRALVETDLETGALVSIFREENPQLGYYLLYRKKLRPTAKLFADWVLGFAK